MARNPVMGVYVLSANRGEGKTTFLFRLADHVAGQKRKVGGIATPAVFENDRRIGYDVVDLHQGRRQLLARLTTRLDSGPIVGAYRFDGAAVRAGNAAVIDAVRDRFDFIGIDEIGPLEFRGEGWATGLGTALAECRPDQAIVIAVRPSLADGLAVQFTSPHWANAIRITPPWPDPARVPLGP